MKILVTGATGYIGSVVTKQLLDDGIDVVATALDVVPQNIDRRATYIPGDIFTIDNPYGFFGCPDAVLHLVWHDIYNHNSDSHIKNLPLHYSFIKNMLNGGVKKVSAIGTMLLCQEIVQTKMVNSTD